MPYCASCLRRCNLWRRRSQVRAAAWRKRFRFTIPAAPLGTDFSDSLVGQHLSFAFPHPFVAMLPHVRHKLIPASRNSNHVSVLAWAFAKRPPQRRHVNGEVVLLHHCVWPNPPHQLVLVHEAPFFLKQYQQNLKSLRGSRTW